MILNKKLRKSKMRSERIGINSKLKKKLLIRLLKILENPKKILPKKKIYLIFLITILLPEKILI